MEEITMNDLAANIQHLLAKTGLEVEVIYHPSREDRTYWIEVQLDDEKQATEWAKQSVEKAPWLASPGQVDLPGRIATAHRHGGKNLLITVEEAEEFKRLLKLKDEPTSDRLNTMMHLLNQVRRTLELALREGAVPSPRQMLINTKDAIISALEGACLEGWWKYPEEPPLLKTEPKPPVGRQVLLTLKEEPEGHAILWIDLPDAGPMAKALINMEVMSSEGFAAGAVLAVVQDCTKDIAEALVGDV